MCPVISPAVQVSRTVRVFSPVNADVDRLAVTPPANSITVCWWSATSLSLRKTQRPYGPVRSASTRPAGEVSGPSSETGHPCTSRSRSTEKRGA